MTDFINADIQTDPNQKVDDAIDVIQAAVPGYQPNEGNLEIIVLNADAQMSADDATAAAVVPASAFRALGTKLFGVAYNDATYATAATTWTVVNAPGTPIPAGTDVTIADQAFYVQADTPVTAGYSGTVSVTLVAADSGTAFNALTGTPQLVDNIDWVTSVALTGATGGGADGETDTAYQTRLANELELQAPRPITAENFTQFVLAAPTSVANVQVGRATTIDGYDPGSGTYNNARTVTTFVTGVDGTALSGPQMTSLATWLASYRELNFVVNVVAPTYTTVYVTFQVHVLPGYDQAAVVANARAAVVAYLSPLLWGSPSPAISDASRWLNSVDGFNVVRINKLIGIVEQVQGVDYVPAGQMKLGTSASPAGTSDITLTGPAPLPTSTLSTILGTAV